MIIRTRLSDTYDLGNSTTRFPEHLCECDDPDCDENFTALEGQPTNYCALHEKLNEIEDSVFTFGRGFNKKKVLAAIEENDEPDDYKTPPLMDRTIAEMIGYKFETPVGDEFVCRDYEAK